MTHEVEFEFRVNDKGVVHVRESAIPRDADEVRLGTTIKSTKQQAQLILSDAKYRIRMVEILRQTYCGKRPSDLTLGHGLIDPLGEEIAKVGAFAGLSRNTT